MKKKNMELMSSIEKSQSTLYSISTKSMISSDYNNDGADKSDDSDSDLSYSEGDVTLMDDDLCDATNEAEKMFRQIVEYLRYEQEVCHITISLFLPAHFWHLHKML